MKINEKLLKSIAKKGSAFVLAGSLLLGSNQIILNDKNSGSTTVYAASQNDSEVVNLNVQMGINLYLNDKGFIPTDADGKQTYPFISEGTTYVPIRAIAELFDANISWNQNSQTVSITTSGKSASIEHTYLEKQNLYNMNINASRGAKLVVNGKECIPKDVDGNIKDIYVVNGTTYVPVRAVSETLGLPISWSEKINSVFIGNHKNYGLTVENINDPKIFKEYSEKFCTFPYEVWTYYDEVNNVYRATNQYQVFRFFMYLLNEEYCSDELLVEIFKDCDYQKLSTIAKVSAIFPERINRSYYYNESIKPYLFEYLVIDENKMQYLKNFQDMAWEWHKTGDYSKIKETAVNYIYGDGNNTFGQGDNLVAGLIVTSWRWQSELNCLDEYEDWDFYNANLIIMDKLQQKADELHEKIYTKQLTKN